jgi:hypothetical protein
MCALRRGRTNRLNTIKEFKNVIATITKTGKRSKCARLRRQNDQPVNAAESKTAQMQNV